MFGHETGSYPWGSPAGKLTTAKALLRSVSGRLFDDNATIELRAPRSRGTGVLGTFSRRAAIEGR
jgi:hypothetical protein